LLGHGPLVTFEHKSVIYGKNARIILPGPHDPTCNSVASSGHALKSRFLQAWMAMVDDLGLCRMIGMTIMEKRADALDQYLTASVSAVIEKV
jgi:hypothetical protein